MQSWWARPHQDASSWHRSCFYTQGWGSLYGPSRISACGLHWRPQIERWNVQLRSITLTAGQRKQKPCESKAHSREWVDHGRDRWFISGADIIKVQHSLYRTSLHTPHYGLGVLIEEGCCLDYGERKPITNSVSIQGHWNDLTSTSVACKGL